MFTVFPKETLIVYLDQNKWIDLVKARVGHRDGQKYQVALHKANELAKQGKAVFPLSWIHFVETRKKRDLKKRKELAEIMAEISRGTAIIPKSMIVDWELQRAVAMAFGKAPIVMPSVFGYGMSMILGRNFLEKEMSSRPDGNPESLRERSKNILSSKEATVSFLIGDDENLTLKVVQGLKQVNEPFVANMEAFRAHQRESTDDLHERVYLAVLTRELQPKLIQLLALYGKTMNDFFGLGVKKVREFFHNIPTLDVEIELALGLHKHWDRKLRLNDASDMAFATISIPYCDIVVTEVFLQNLAKRRKLDKKYDTLILSDLNDLLPLFEGL